jgi:hypothetical protein
MDMTNCAMEMGLLHYARHFGLLACVTALLAATHPMNPVQGVVASFGLYGALHACILAATLRRFESWRRKFAFVAGASALSMVGVALCLHASRWGAPMPGMVKPALLLAAASAFGAASYALLIRYCFGAGLGPKAIGSITLACVVATLGVLASRLYLVGGTLWFAGAWWFAFSGALRYQDPPRRALVKAARPAANPLR